MQWKHNKNRINPSDIKVSAYLLYAYVYESMCTHKSKLITVLIVCVHMDVWACVFAKLYMHECASQSVCASATVSTPLGLSTKPAQRQMGNFLRGKGKKSGAAAKAAGCVSFPPRLKSDRVKDTETLRYLQTVGEKIKETAWENKGIKKIEILSGISSPLSSVYLLSFSAFEESTAHYLFIVSW